MQAVGLLLVYYGLTRFTVRRSPGISYPGYSMPGYLYLFSIVTLSVLYPGYPMAYPLWVTLWLAYSLFSLYGLPYAVLSRLSLPPISSPLSLFPPFPPVYRRYRYAMRHIL